MGALKAVQTTKWYQTRPKLIQALVDQFPPVSSVRIKSTGQMAYVYAYSEDGTLSLVIDPKAAENKNISCAMSVIYTVFGYAPETLELLHENSADVGLMVGDKLQAAAEQQVICGECSQPKITGSPCGGWQFNCFGVHVKDACAYHGGFCCECEADYKKSLN